MMLLSTKIRNLLVISIFIFPLIGMTILSNQLGTILSDLSLDANNYKLDYIVHRNTTKHHSNLPPIKEEEDDGSNHDKENAFEEHPHPNTIIRFENAEELPLDYREVAFQLARKRAKARRTQRTKEEKLYSSLKDLYPPPPNNDTENLKYYVLNLIRVPKAGSSALSVTARALAGCQPDGYPCCEWEKDQKACPRKDLFCDAIKGCTMHRPNYDELMDERLIVNNNDYNKHYPSLSMVREPVSRLISGFFYQWPHRPFGRNHNWYFFESDFISMPRYRNVLTKMLNGQTAYSNFSETLSTTAGAKSRLCQITSFGISSSPIGLALLLYESGSFRSLQPHPVAFELQANSPNQGNHTNTINGSTITGNNTKNYTKISLGHAALRVGKDNRKYRLFIENVFSKRGGMELVQRYNQEDIEVYQFAKRLYCARVREAGLFEATKKVCLLHLYKECFEKLLDTSNNTFSLNNESTNDLCGPLEGRH